MKELTPQNSSVLLMFISIITWYNIIQTPGYKIFGCIDIQVEILPVEIDELTARPTGESSAEIRKRVVAAREIQESRFAGERDVHCNAQMNSRLMALHCALDPQAEAILKKAMVKYDMSARAYDRILKLARTIADLDASPSIEARHISEAVAYRTLDRSAWGKFSPQ